MISNVKNRFKKLVEGNDIPYSKVSMVVGIPTAEIIKICVGEKTSLGCSKINKAYYDLLHHLSSYEDSYLGF